MKFAHLSDCHIGGWREPKLRLANADSFCFAIRKCIAEQVDFVLISGDLFNTAIPAIDSLKMAVEQLKKLKDAQVPVYIIAGSHDFSPSGRTMLDVLEQAGLAVNVARGDELADGRVRLHFTIDPKTKIKITGMIGKKGGLESGYYHYLAKEYLENEQGPKIFLFHSALAELKPKGMEKMEAMAVSLMPQGFDYYAGGHVHVVNKVSLDKYKNIVYPGPIFPNNFSELEKLKNGSFVLVKDWQIEHVPIVVYPQVSIEVDAEQKTPSETVSSIKERILINNLKDAIVTLRVFGCLKQGRPSDIPWNDLLHDAYAKGAYCVLRNTFALTSKEIEVIMVKEANVEEVESSLLKEHASQFKLSEKDVEDSRKLMQVLSAEKKDGERVNDFEARFVQECDVLFGGC